VCVDGYPAESTPATPDTSRVDNHRPAVTTITLLGIVFVHGLFIGPSVPKLGFISRWTIGTSHTRMRPSTWLLLGGAGRELPGFLIRAVELGDPLAAESLAEIADPIEFPTEMERTGRVC